MRLFSLALASLVSLGCGLPCRDRDLVLGGLGGPVGWIIAAADRCEETVPPPTPATHVAAAEPADPAVVDMATMPPPVDMAAPIPTVSRDMTPLPPPADLSPVQLSLSTSGVANWYLSGPITRGSGSSYNVAPSFDFVRSAVVPAEIKIPIASIPASGRQPREIKVAYSVDVDFAWASPSPLCSGQVGTYYAKEAGFSACLRSQVQVQVFANDNLVDDRVVASGTFPRHVTVALPPGQFIPGVEPGMRIDVRLRVVGDVIVSGVTSQFTAQLSW